MEPLKTVLGAKIVFPTDKQERVHFYSLITVLVGVALAPTILLCDFRDGVLNSFEVGYWSLLLITFAVSSLNTIFEEFTQEEEGSR